MSSSLPLGATVRPPSAADAEDILGLVVAYNLATVGFADYTLDDVRDELEEPGFVAATDGWLVHDTDAALIGYGWSRRREASAQVDIDIVSLDPMVAAWLTDTALERVRTAGRDSGHDTMTVDQSVYAADRGLQEVLAERGFAHATSYHRMRIDHSDPSPSPTLPDGVTLQHAGDDVALRAVALVVLNAAFADHFSHEDRELAEWTSTLQTQSTFAWSQLTVASLDAQPVAVLQCNDQFVPDEDCGYVARLGVLPAARGRGIAKALLRHAFAIDAAAGRTGTILHVDTNNPTPALGLYRAVGMREVLEIDVWRAQVRTRPEAQPIENSGSVIVSPRSDPA